MPDQYYVLVDAADRVFPEGRRRRIRGVKGAELRTALANSRTIQRTIQASTSIRDLTETASLGPITWPWRLYEVEGDTTGNRDRHDGRSGTATLRSFTIAAELPQHELFGPNGPELINFFEKLDNANTAELSRNDITRNWRIGTTTLQAVALECQARGLDHRKASHAAYNATEDRRASAILAELVANQFVGRHTTWYERVTGGGQSDAGTLAQAIVGREHLAEHHFATLLAPFIATLHGPDR